MSKLIDAKELAKRLKVTPATIHAWHRRGWLPCLRAGRRPVFFDLDAVEQALHERAQPCSTWPPAWMNQPTPANERDDDYEFEERAAIMEFDGGLSRDETERRAGLRPNRQTLRRPDDSTPSTRWRR